MDICSLVSEKNGNKHRDRQTNRYTNIGFTSCKQCKKRKKNDDEDEEDEEKEGVMED